MSSESYFAEVAPDWDRLSAGFFSERVREKALDLANLEGNLVAADLGAGTGFLSGALLQRGLEVFAVDQSEDMLKQIPRKYGYERIRWVVADGEDLPLPDASVDRVLANMYLHHVESPAAAIKEAARILKPGGRIVITDLDEHAYDFLRWEQHDRWLGFNRRDVAQWLHNAGFEDVAVDDIAEECSATSRTSVDTASITIFAAHANRERRKQQHTDSGQNT